MYDLFITSFKRTGFVMQMSVHTINVWAIQFMLYNSYSTVQIDLVSLFLLVLDSCYSSCCHSTFLYFRKLYLTFLYMRTITSTIVCALTYNAPFVYIYLTVSNSVCRFSEILRLCIFLKMTVRYFLQKNILTFYNSTNFQHNKGATVFWYKLVSNSLHDLLILKYATQKFSRNFLDLICESFSLKIQIILNSEKYRY